MIDRWLRGRRVPVPNQLEAVTQYDPARECAPETVGMRPSDVDAIWAAAQGVYRTGLHPGMTLVIRRRGQVVLRRAIGHAEGNAPGRQGSVRKRLLQPETPICLFSASKAVTAMLVHKLAEQGELRLEDRVVDYLPEFGQRGKHRITILDLLSHRAGIPRIPPKHARPELLFDWAQALDVLCRARPLRGAGQQQAYHAITAGFVLGEIIRRVSGRELNDVLHNDFATPMKLAHFSYGLPPGEHAHAAQNAFTGPRLLPPVGAIVKRILGAPFEDVADISNDPCFLSAVIPAGNLYASGDDICDFFQMMLNGGTLHGQRIFQPETIARAIQPIGRIRPDSSLFVPVRFSAGMVMGEWPFGLYGRNCPEAYGHLGFINIICWADPARQISVALLNTGKHMAADGILALARLQAAISRHCPRDAQERAR